MDSLIVTVFFRRTLVFVLRFPDTRMSYEVTKGPRSRRHDWPKLDDVPCVQRAVRSTSATVHLVHHVVRLSGAMTRDVYMSATGQVTKSAHELRGEESKFGALHSDATTLFMQQRPSPSSQCNVVRQCCSSLRLTQLLV